MSTSGILRHVKCFPRYSEDVRECVTGLSDLCDAEGLLRHDCSDCGFSKCHRCHLMIRLDGSSPCEGLR